MLLHKDASYQTYSAFFSHLCAELEHSIDNIELRLHESIEFGSDDEITKAIENSFPNTKRRLCTKHLKDNVIKHYLQKPCWCEHNRKKQYCQQSSVMMD